MDLKEVILNSENKLGLFKEDLKAKENYLEFYKLLSSSNYNYLNKNQYLDSKFKGIIDILKFYFVQITKKTEYESFILDREFDIITNHFYHKKLKIFIELKFLGNRNFWSSKARNEKQKIEQIKFLNRNFEEFRYIKIYFNIDNQITTNFYYSKKINK